MTASTLRRLVVALTLVLVVSTLITPALATPNSKMQQARSPTNNTTTSSPAANTTTTTNSSGPPGRSHWIGNASGSGGMFGMGIDIPKPRDAAKAAVDYIVDTWLADQLTKLFKNLANAFTGFIVGTPYPENKGAYGIFGLPKENPSHGQAFWYDVFYQFYIPITGSLSIFLLVVTHLTSGISATLTGHRHGSVDGIDLLQKTILGGLFIGIWWQLGTAFARLTNELALWIAPTGDQLVSSMTGLVKVSAGAVLTIIFTKGLGASEMAILAIIYATRHGLIILYQVTMPILVVLTLTAPKEPARRFFGSLAWHYLTLLVIVFPGAALLRLGFIIDMDFGFGPIGNALVSMGFLGGAVLSVLILGWTSIATRRYAGKMGQAANEGTPSKETVSNSAGRVKDRVGSATERVRDRSGGVLRRGADRARSGAKRARSRGSEILQGSNSESGGSQSQSRRKGSLRSDREDSAGNNAWGYTAASNRARPTESDD